MTEVAAGRSRRREVVRKTLLVISACLLLFPPCLVLGHAAVSGNVSLYRDLTRNGVASVARVVRTEPKNHGAVFYEYRVNGRQYEYGGPSRGYNPDVENLAIGDSLEIVYSRVNPARSCACHPETELRRNSSLVWPFGWGLTIFFTLAVINLWTPRANSPDAGSAAERTTSLGPSWGPSPQVTSARTFLGGQILGRIGGIVALAGLIRQSEEWTYAGFALAMGALLVMAVLIAMNSRQVPLLGVGVVALARKGNLPANTLALVDALLTVSVAGAVSILLRA